MKNETEPLKEFIITVDGKPFIKCDDPEVRVDFKFNKFKPRRSFKMAGITLTEQIALAIEALPISHSEEDLIQAINGIVQNMDVTNEIILAINAHGYPGLTPEDLRNIIRGIVDNKVA